MKKALLITFEQTVRVEADVEEVEDHYEVNESIIEEAFILAQEVMSINDPLDSLKSIVDDLEMPYTEEL